MNYEPVTISKEIDFKTDVSVTCGNCSSDMEIEIKVDSYGDLDITATCKCMVEK